MGLQVIGAERDWRFSGFALLTLVWSVDRGGSRSGIHCLQGLGFSVFCVQGLGGQSTILEKRSDVGMSQE